MSHVPTRREVNHARSFPERSNVNGGSKGKWKNLAPLPAREKEGFKTFTDYILTGWGKNDAAPEKTEELDQLAGSLTRWTKESKHGVEDIWERLDNLQKCIDNQNRPEAKDTNRIKSDEEYYRELDSLKQGLLEWAEEAIKSLEDFKRKLQRMEGSG
ncbi:hypothetical protein BP6252_05939 [Coleophoma cylindrospora]|uniref:Uncharacterized protein n=1 Tax=Coleophoma cylindrospora TaxID=1849047 RepID=A0A3D8RL72_9HELO|nr:hypothetical protein BP6252_05939 [Coleophoma cylindrospora]